jgi:hypothetical protein
MSYQRDDAIYLVYTDEFNCVCYPLGRRYTCDSPQAALAWLDECGDAGVAVSSRARYRLMAEICGEITAQDLYDLRSVIGFCSGGDLHDLFDTLVGEPSPSGKVSILTQGLVDCDLGQQILHLLVEPLTMIRQADYCLN